MNNLSRLIFTSLIILSSVLLNAQEKGSECWPSFRGDSRLTGTTTQLIKPPVKLLWSFDASDAIKASPVVANKRVFIASTDGFVYALDFTGQLIWKFNTGNSIEASPVILDNSVIVGNLEGNIFSLDAATGKQKWKYTTDGQISGSVNWTLSPDRKQKWILVGSYDFFLHCVNASTGKVCWKYESENYLNGTPALWNNMAVFGGCDGFLHLVNTGNGKSSLKMNIGTYIPASAAISGNRAYFGNYDGDFSATT
ncbi:MAG: PQQ-binding-like beta-propeller repeat protein [Bacteroidales bacterium]|nr:PQQ-binding-like beta-propeller repeat protein [Bacteroidales bacterium]